MSAADVPGALQEVASVARRLAVLLAAGVPPERAWTYLAEPPAASPMVEERPTAVPRSPTVEERRNAAFGSPMVEERPQGASRNHPFDAPAVIRAAAHAASRADDVARAITASCAEAPPLSVSRSRADAWRLFAAAYAVAATSGAPLAACLHRFAAGIGRAAALHRELDVAFAGPRATARLVGVLPLVALLFGLGLGFDTVHVLTATPVGWGCLAGGAGLMLLSRRWSRRLLATAEPTELAPGLELELVAVAMSSGISAERARRLVESALDGPGLRSAADAHAADAVLDLALRAGVPTVGLLQAEAERRRDEADAQGRSAAAAVAVRLMLPLAVCVLPAFMLLGVVPVVVALVTGSGITLG